MGMFYTSVDDESKYNVIKIDNKIFYEEKKRKRRYSDQFKTKHTWKQKYKRYLLLKKCDLNSLEKSIIKWKDCISNCIDILVQENVDVNKVFELYNLEKLGFNKEEYC